MGGGALSLRVWGLGGVTWRLDASHLPNPACRGARPSCFQEPVFRRGVSGDMMHQENGELA